MPFQDRLTMPCSDLMELGAYFLAVLFGKFYQLICFGALRLIEIEVRNWIHLCALSVGSAG